MRPSCATRACDSPGSAARDPLAARRTARTILAETKGPGIIQRLWFAPATLDQAASVEPIRGRLRIQLDHQSQPVLDVPLADLFAAQHPHFPGTLMRECGGCFIGYVPIPFRDGCLVTVEGKAALQYEISVLSVPSAEGLGAFPSQPTPEEANALQLARTLWQEPEALFENVPSFSAQRLRRALSLWKQLQEAEYPVEGSERSTQLFALPPGPRTIRSLDAIIDPKTTENWRKARLRLVWEADDVSQSAIDLPMGEFFAQAPRSLPYRALMAGANENVWSNRFPMPYRGRALLQIDADGPIKGAIRIRSVRGAEPGAGYFRAVGRDVTPTGPEQRVEWLNETGRGHLVGTFVTAKGRGDRASWLGQTLSLSADDRAPFPLGTDLAREFNGAWPEVKGGLDQARAFPLSGFPVYRREGESWSLAAYRWRLSDPVPFEHSIALRVEPAADGTTRVDKARAALFWYSERSGPVRARQVNRHFRRGVNDERGSSWDYASQLVARGEHSRSPSRRKSRACWTMPSGRRGIGKECHPETSVSSPTRDGPTSRRAPCSSSARKRCRTCSRWARMAGGFICRRTCARWPCRSPRVNPCACASLPGLRGELAELAERWELPLDDEALNDLLHVSRDPDDGWVADAPDVLAFARLVLAANEAVRRDCPLWVLG